MNNINEAALHNLVKENEALKRINHNLSSLLIAPMVDNKPVDLVWLTRDDLKDYSDVHQAGGINAIRISAIRDLARTECPVSGPIITSEESRKQMLEWADFEEKYSNE